MFGRAGRPQFDKQGYVFALPHEDDVKILRWKEKYDQIPEDTKDPGLRKAKKSLKKKQPKRREGQQYWTQEQFEKLVASPSGELASRGPLPWRLLVYMIDASPEVELIRRLVDGRLLDAQMRKNAQKQLNRQLITLWRGGYMTLDPKPPLDPAEGEPEQKQATTDEPAETISALALDLGQRKSELDRSPAVDQKTASTRKHSKLSEAEQPIYQPETAEPTEKMGDLLKLRGVHPLYAVFLKNHLGIADRNERIMAFESILELSRSLGRAVRIPPPEVLPPGPLATTRLDAQLLKLGWQLPRNLEPSKKKKRKTAKAGTTRTSYVPCSDVALQTAAAV